MCGIKIDEAFLGSCNNGRIEDLRVGASILKGHKVADSVRFLVVPASLEIYKQALKEGLIDIFMDAGAIVMNPNCSVCWAAARVLSVRMKFSSVQVHVTSKGVPDIQAPRFILAPQQQSQHLPLQEKLL